MLAACLKGQNSSVWHQRMQQAGQRIHTGPAWLPVAFACCARLLTVQMQRYSSLPPVSEAGMTLSAPRACQQCRRIKAQLACVARTTGMLLT